MLKRLLPVILATVALAACSKKDESPAAAEAASGKVDVIVNETGFVPSTIKAKVGQPITLSITRKTDKTCATEIVIKELNINTPLPLNQTVPVTVTPKQKGDLRFACAMDHIRGTIVAE